jgi:hypothetical protein
MTNFDMRRWHRQIYHREYAEQRRAAAKAAGAKRIDVTLQGQALDDYQRVKDWLDRTNRLAIERGIYNTPKTLPDGQTYTIPAPPLSATEIIKAALRLAASKIADEEKGS